MQCFAPPQAPPALPLPLTLREAEPILVKFTRNSPAISKFQERQALPLPFPPGILNIGRRLEWKVQMGHFKALLPVFLAFLAFQNPQLSLSFAVHSGPAAAQSDSPGMTWVLSPPGRHGRDRSTPFHVLRRGRCSAPAIMSASHGKRGKGPEFSGVRVADRRIATASQGLQVSDRGKLQQAEEEVDGTGMVRGGTSTLGTPWTEYLSLPEVASAVSLPAAPEEEVVSDSEEAHGKSRGGGAWHRLAVSVSRRPVDDKLARWRARSKFEAEEEEEVAVEEEEGRSAVAMMPRTVGILSAMHWERVVAAELDVELKLRMWRGMSRAGRHSMVGNLSLFRVFAHTHKRAYTT
jgi:hypothetical protein